MQASRVGGDLLGEKATPGVGGRWSPAWAHRRTPSAGRRRGRPEPVPPPPPARPQPSLGLPARPRPAPQQREATAGLGNPPTKLCGGFPLVMLGGRPSRRAPGGSERNSTSTRFFFLPNLAILRPVFPVNFFLNAPGQDFVRCRGGGTYGIFAPWSIHSKLQRMCFST